MCVVRGSFVLLACVAVALTLVLASAPSTSPPALSFVAAGEYENYYPRSVVIRDLNGDGRPELVVAAAPFQLGHVYVYANTGGGRFQPSGDYPTPGSSLSVAIADLNSDGKPDVVTSNANGGPGGVSVFVNRGDGSLQAGVDYETDQGTASVAVGDLTGDGKPDLATANSFASTVSVLVNRGDGTFGDKTNYPSVDGPYSVAIGDVNGDGLQDLATANYGNFPNRERTVSVLVNSGHGGFQPARQYAVGLGPQSVVLADVSGDGHPDLVTANTLANSVSVLLNPGDGSFVGRRDYATGRSPQQVAVGDVDGDGRLDLATPNYYSHVLANQGTVSVLLNKDGGTFYSRLDYATGDHPGSVAVGDVNGDGRADLATTYYSKVNVLLNTPRRVCTVQNLLEKTRPAAKQVIVRSNCRVGKIRWEYSTNIRRGRVTFQTVSPGKVLPNRSYIGFNVSLGPLH
jgi:predicted NUDIX family NTP pyrophosphohydrolase